MRKGPAAIVVAVMSAVLGFAGATTADAAGGVVLWNAHYDSPGPDYGGNASLTAEYIALKNTSTSTKTITGWTLRDRQNHVYKFPTTTIGAGKYLFVRTGKGTNNATTRYWNQTWYIWNNSGDTAYLRNSAGSTVDTCGWGSGHTSIQC
ncbi:lamin tail domain-containing protein [Labedaea rhizosphaerae]|uniref:Lamin tail-like protein n=1 Tax=Labedaea rhizosphaerae TaxID=598644 RepID=A0A4V3CYG5_LABRH|nr:lamin tail domain-containing protein [Labedaea rhizosphaerae]TDP94018.1 lamin tail-like protein [Labedaea rhizosphaerae]